MLTNEGRIKKEVLNNWEMIEVGMKLKEHMKENITVELENNI